MTATRLAGDVRSALVSVARPNYPRTLIDRMIDQALDKGHDIPSALAQTTHRRSVADPGPIWAPMDAALWWNFTDTMRLRRAFAAP